ncbi:low-density lipoprotein receptor-related protein 4 isoform X2 [Venturia canescens]|uniref:low-density lipoprotein receptor-related protein 4 isoform X2 n=1 Tax=Venturia canescens TaxID=32260 RepID=UPI001C9C2B08|nr:low-density lipoprotein receptor-related protein 4 isoform X2 [Venturia canescens]
MLKTRDPRAWSTRKMRSSADDLMARTIKQPMPLLFIILSLWTGGAMCVETSTHLPVNRGAARQMYGSGSLRQTGSGPVLDVTTAMSGHARDKNTQDTRNDVRQDEKSLGHLDLPEHPEEYPHESHGGGYQTGHDESGAWSRNPAQIPRNPFHLTPGMFPRIPGQPSDYHQPSDVPSYRNGAPVNGMRIPVSNGGIYGQGRTGGMSRGVDRGGRGRGGVYGASSAVGGYEDREVADRSRFNNGLERGHGVGPVGEADPDRFGPDQKTLIQELEDESDFTDFVAPCGWICLGGYFLCSSSCICVSMEQRCDGKMDCENNEDEVNCDEVLEERNSNGNCYGQRNRRCPISGHCISDSWICDGDDDCGDYSDEAPCGNRLNCTEEQFQCRNGLCVERAWLCDGDNDCMDYSDEEDCAEKKKCKEDEFTCPDGMCIMNEYRCDGEYDCRDGSDEAKCEIFQDVHCGENYFECATPRCIKIEYRCDGDDDCGDASDEENCPNTVEPCPDNNFRCANGECISESKMCDGKSDCPNGEDEMAPCKNLTPKPCSPTDEYHCESSHCVPRTWVCDGVMDCPNGDDEELCAFSCDVTQYLCKAIPSVGNDTISIAGPSHAMTHHFHPYCISKKHVCDGFPDCPEKDDEVDCPTKRECTPTDRCTQQCILTANNEKTCSCEFGFVLGPDNATCHDVNECEFEKDPVCSQLCNNTLGSFTCSCMRGYVLRPDFRTCKAIGANLKLLFTNRVDIRKMTLGPPKQSKHTPILKGLHNAIALGYHYKRGVIYWSDVSMDVIRKVYINGSDPEDVLRWGLDMPGGIAIDWIHDLLFWTDAGTSRIEVITLDTNIRHVLISSDLGKPRAIAVHPHYGYVFWTDWGSNPKIERADMDGSDRTAIVTTSITWPNGLTIDYTTDRIFWTDAKPAFIESANLDGTGRKKILSKGLYHPFAITVFEDLIYWTDWHFKSVSSANKANGRGFKTIYSGIETKHDKDTSIGFRTWKSTDSVAISFSGLHFPIDLHSYHPQRQPDFPNHCGDNNGKCSHMCLPNSAGYSCVCPVGLKIKRDGKNCATTADNLLIFARKRDLRMIPIDQTTRAFDTVIPVDHVASAVALTWDSNEDTIYWTDVEANSISRAHLNGTNQSLVIYHNLVSPAGLAMDWISKKLYWTDAGTNRIECSNLDGSMRTLLVYEGLDKPRDIVVDPISAYMYWSDWGKTPKIERASMDGSQRRVLIGANLTWPNGLAIDFDKKRLYWADGGTKSIEYSDLDGKNRTVLMGNLPHPFGLVIHRNKIYWTDWETLSIHRADKNTGGNVTVVRSGITGLMDVRAFHRNRRTSENPCHPNNGNCSHLCLVARRTRHMKCACPTGIRLQADGKTCATMPSKFVIFAHRIDIRVLSLDVDYSVDVAVPIPFMKNASGVDVDLRNAQIYWSDPDEDVIKKTFFNGSAVETIIDTGIDTVDSLVVDSIGRKIYWTDAGLNSVEVSELDGRNRKVLVWSGLDSPRAIVLHYERGFIYWSDWGLNARIERANMDGEERETIIADNLVWPNGLAIDYEEKRLYWTDAKRKVIESSDLDGENRKIVIKNASYPYGLTVMGEYIYWSDWHSQGLVRANKTSGLVLGVVSSKLDGVLDVRSVNIENARLSDNVCGKNNGGCSHLCLRNPRGFSCACPSGILLNDDKKTCNTTPSNFLLSAARKGLARISFDTPDMREVALPVTDVHRALSIDFHWSRGQILYTDTISARDKGFMIKSVNMRNYSDVKTIITGSESISPFSVAVDWIANNLYWTDMKHKVVAVARIDGTSQKTIVSGLEDPRSLALFPRQGYVFWTEWGDRAKIQRSLLDGSNPKAIVSTDLAFPNGLSIDYASKKIFWADSLKDRIETSDLHGRYRVTLVSGFIDPFGLTQYGQHIYWANWKLEMIQRADKETGENRVPIRTSLGFMTDLKSISVERQTGWTPCAIDNGGCSHLCLFARKSYKCACPDVQDPKCSTVAKKQVPLRKPGSENDPDAEELDDDEPKYPEIATGSNNRGGDDKFKNFKSNQEKKYSLRTVIITVVAMLAFTAVLVVIIIILLCQRKARQGKYRQYASRRNVRTFSNPNYNASGADVAPGNPQQEKKSFIWKRLKYDSSQRANPSKVECPIKLQHLPLHFIQMNETTETT